MFHVKHRPKRDPDMPEELRSAILRIVAYNWDDEERDYADNPDHGHIFEDLCTVRIALGTEPRS